MWRAVKSSLNYLNKDARDLLEEYERNMTGKTANKSRWKTCVELVNEGLTQALGKTYVEKHFQEPAKQDMIEMVGYIKNEFGNILNDVDWMDEETRYRAESKLLAITDYVGYPQELLNEAKVHEFYHGLEIKQGEFFKNSAKISVWKINTEWKKLRLKVSMSHLLQSYTFTIQWQICHISPQVDKTDWKRHAYPTVVNAFYNPIENSIQFPAGVLQV